MSRHAVRVAGCALLLAVALGFGAALRVRSAPSARLAPSGLAASAFAAAPTFYRDVLPILERHCQRCHRAGEIGPMPLVTYADAKVKADEIAEKTAAREMPPWFADPRFGQFANDPSLSAAEIATLTAWAKGGAPAGDASDPPAGPHWTDGWNIPQPDAVVQMPKAVALASDGEVDYTYEIVPSGFAEDKWVRMSEIRPTSRENVHHAVVYVRPPGSKWLAKAPRGLPFTADDLEDEASRHDAHWTDADILLVYAPGSAPDSWPAGMAKLVPAGSDLVFQMHYITSVHAAKDRTSIGLVFAEKPQQQRVLTLQLTNSRFVIPPGANDYRVEARGTLPNDALLLSFLPHMHLRGKEFEYNIVQPDGESETLLRVKWDFYWQLSYRLEKPLALKAGTELQAVARYDNSAANPHNPDPGVAVRWGDQTSDEMMVGFFDVAVPLNFDKQRFFMRDAEMISVAVAALAAVRISLPP